MKTLLRIINSVANKTKSNGLILFPAGWFETSKRANTLYSWVEKEIMRSIVKIGKNIKVCLGIDGRVKKYAKDQIGICIGKDGIEAIGRKFYPTKDEEPYIEIAENHLSREEGRTRIFEMNGKRFYICVCYDVFGIKHRGIPNPGVDVILDLVHGFCPRGEGNSGDVNFARHGFAGASNAWKCPVFGSTVFFNRRIPQRWPSAVYWNEGKTHSNLCTYDKIRISPINTIQIKVREGIVLIRIYEASKE